MSLVALRAAVASTIDTQISAFASVDTHGGKFGPKEVRRIATKTPAARVALLGGTMERQGSQGVAEPQLAVFVITRGSSTDIRDAQAIALAESVAGLALSNTWDYEHAQAGTAARIDNLFTGDLDGHGIAIWVVSWRQAIDIDIYDATALEDFHTLYADMDLAPADGVINSEQIIQVGGEFMSAYGHINVSTAVATSIAVAGTYQKLAGTTELNKNSDMDMPANNRLRHNGSVVKPFLATASASITVSADAKVTLAFAKNGTVDTDTAIEQEVTLAGGAEAFSLKTILDLAPTDYVEVWVKADGLVNVTATKANLVVAAT